MKDKNHDILLFQRVLPAYRVPVFRRLYHDFGILTCFSRPLSSSNLNNEEEEIDFPAVRLDRFQIGHSSTSIIQNPLPSLIRYRPSIVISEGAPSYFTMWFLLLLRPIFRFKLCLWSHGVKFHEMNRPFTTLRGRIQKWLFNHADALILYSDRRASIVKQNINFPGKVFVARNTLDTNELNKVYQHLLQEGKEKIKNDLGFKARFNLVFIGRLLPYKGLDDLLEAFAMLPEDLGAELHIIGDGPEKNKHLIKKGNDPRIKFYGSISDLKLTGKFLYSSDLMVMPGSVGLSVVHAFAFGCPVITYERLAGKRPGHGPEVEYIRDHVNGIFCEASPASLANTLAELLSTTSKIAAMSEKALETVQHEASIEQMMDGFHNMIMYLNPSKKE